MKPSAIPLIKAQWGGAEHIQKVVMDKIGDGANQMSVVMMSVTN